MGDRKVHSIIFILYWLLNQCENSRDIDVWQFTFPTEGFRTNLSDKNVFHLKDSIKILVTHFLFLRELNIITI